MQHQKLTKIVSTYTTTTVIIYNIIEIHDTQALTPNLKSAPTQPKIDVTTIDHDLVTLSHITPTILPLPTSTIPIPTLPVTPATILHHSTHVQEDIYAHIRKFHVYQGYMPMTRFFFTNQTVYFLITSAAEKKYLFVLYECNSNHIYVVEMTLKNSTKSYNHTKNATNSNKNSSKSTIKYIIP